MEIAQKTVNPTDNRCLGLAEERVVLAGGSVCYFSSFKALSPCVSMYITMGS